jgi:hypothetical protein
LSDELRPLHAPPHADGDEDEGRVEALFTGGGPDSVRFGRSRTMQWLLLVALPLNLAGLLTCTLVPGTLLTLWAWSIGRRELAILEHGELPVQETLRLSRLDRLARVMLVACALLLAAQVYLLTTGFYQGLLLRADLWLAGG